ncbi:MAG: tRNA (adenosine(37)-N6)-threonylcarbamoyltransferase complex ATPase subunit type 1 TsaE [Lachnospiraceae bacterium]|nr:tRNA (adenosine(37)-N6)-threonylcarbamoyltransferase complex ATPase subunit type 1 TsaE [Lachnospiraceae bacterium]
MTDKRITTSPEETAQIGRELASEAGPGMVITLNGDLGTGKTVFAQGFAAGLGVKDYINSPTFTILQVYEDGCLPLYHFDVYRIGDPEEMDEIGFDEYVYGEGVSLIEWAELISDILPERRIDVRIRKLPDQGDDVREITIERQAEGRQE